MLNSLKLGMLSLAIVFPAYGQDDPPKIVRIVPQTVTETFAVIKQDLVS